MPTAKITKRAVDSLKPGAKDQYLWDTTLRGFGVKTTPQGRRVFLVQYRLGGRKGRTRRVNIGPYSEQLTVEKARLKAKRILGQVADGRDPAEVRSEERRDLTVAELCDLYLAEGCATKKASTISMDRSRIARHVKPLLGSKRLRALSRADIERFQSDVAAGRSALDERTGPRGRAIVTGGKGVASRSVGMLGAILHFAVARGLRADNPVRGVKRFPDRHCERFLSPQELARLGTVLAEAEAAGQNGYAIAASRLLLLTGCRRQEILGLRWENVDFEHEVLRLPDSKTGQKIVHLGADAINLLHALPRITGNPHVLPGAKIKGHFVGLPKIWRQVRGRADLSDVRLHDLRHSFGAVGATGGDSLLVIGALLGHKNPSTTKRYAHLSNHPVRAAANRISGEIAASMGDPVAPTPQDSEKPLR